MSPRQTTELPAQRADARRFERRQPRLAEPEPAAGEAARPASVLEENARLARATMLAIDRYVETAIRLLTCGPGGPQRARERAVALGLHRLEEYLACKLRDAGELDVGTDTPGNELLEETDEDSIGG